MTTFVIPIISFDENGETADVAEALTGYYDFVQEANTAYGKDVSFIYPMTMELVAAFNQEWGDGEQGPAMTPLVSAWDIIEKDEESTLSIVFPSTTTMRELSAFDAGPEGNLAKDAEIFVKGRGKDVYTSAIQTALQWLDEDQEDGEVAGRVHVLFIGEPPEDVSDAVDKFDDVTASLFRDIRAGRDEDDPVDDGEGPFLDWRNGPAEIVGDEIEDDEEVERTDGAPDYWAAVLREHITDLMISLQRIQETLPGLFPAPKADEPSAKMKKEVKATRYARPRQRRQ